MKYVAAIDRGPLVPDVFFLTRRGSRRPAPSRSTGRYIRGPGWVEHDPTEIWARTMGVFAEALGLVRGEPGDLAAIGVTNQRERTVIWEKSTGHLI